jgi:hypothetical protein
MRWALRHPQLKAGQERFRQGGRLHPFRRREQVEWQMIARLRLGVGMSLALVTAWSGTFLAQDLRAALDRYVASHQRAIVSELVELLAIPNTAADSENIRRNAALLRDMLRRRSFASEILETDSNPLVWGELKVPGAERTLLIWAHYSGQPLRRIYTVTRTVVPTLRQTSQDVNLLPAGDVRKPDQTLLDIRLGRRFQAARGLAIEPLLEIYNLLNENASVQEVEQVGPALGRISRNIDGRLVRFGVKVSF